MKWLLALAILFTVSIPVLADSGPSPYSFATGKTVVKQKEQSKVNAATTSVMDQLRGPAGTSLCLVSMALSIAAFAGGLKAAAFLFMAMSIMVLSVSHPLIASALFAVGLVIRKFWPKPRGEIDVVPKKRTDGSINPLNPTSGTPPASADTSSAPKLNRPL